MGLSGPRCPRRSASDCPVTPLGAVLNGPSEPSMNLTKPNGAPDVLVEVFVTVWSLHVAQCLLVPWSPGRTLQSPKMHLDPCALVQLLLTTYYTCEHIPSIPQILNSGMLMGVKTSRYLWKFCPTTCNQGSVNTHKHS